MCISEDGILHIYVAYAKNKTDSITVRHYVFKPVLSLTDVFEITGVLPGGSNPLYLFYNCQSFNGHTYAVLWGKPEAGAAGGQAAVIRDNEVVKVLTPKDFNASDLGVPTSVPNVSVDVDGWLYMPFVVDGNHGMAVLDESFNVYKFCRTGNYRFSYIGSQFVDPWYYNVMQLLQSGDYAYYKVTDYDCNEIKPPQQIGYARYLEQARLGWYYVYNKYYREYYPMWYASTSYDIVLPQFGVVISRSGVYFYPNVAVNDVDGLVYKNAAVLWYRGYGTSLSAQWTYNPSPYHKVFDHTRRIVYALNDLSTRGYYNPAQWKNVIAVKIIELF
jgi:hypothetical protein